MVTLNRRIVRLHRREGDFRDKLAVLRLTTTRNEKLKITYFTTFLQLMSILEIGFVPNNERIIS